MFKKSKLKKCHLFSNLTDEELKLVADITEERKEKKGTVLFYEGSNNQDLYLIIDGTVEISICITLEEKFVITKVKNGGIIGDFAFVDEGARSATATVVDDAHLLVISKSAFEKLIFEHPRIGLVIYKELAKEVCKKIRERNKELRSSLIWESLE
ncbi:MAG TPA: cyclic nucleotide-binding domain-containing protein [bacterium]|nr:cyclic nucleotide-binding domain-containing protein [bacterium]HOL47495.1 cyclic nucleotide-binding domain-containing protein [bacterium]HPQ19583.1 cyclic nucleotide-binding domain-containing protein [bacterium]